LPYCPPISHDLVLDTLSVCLLALGVVRYIASLP
jgi:hypothetical protein